MIKTININRCTLGMYVRWYYNGWHHWMFNDRYEISDAVETRGTQVTERFSHISRIEKPTSKRVRKFIYLGHQGLTVEEYEGLQGIIQSERVEIYVTGIWFKIEIKRQSYTVRRNQANAYNLMFQAEIKDAAELEHRLSVYTPGEISEPETPPNIFLTTKKGTAGETSIKDTGGLDIEIEGDTAIVEYGMQYRTAEVSYQDWYLPSLDELNLVYTNIYAAGIGSYDSSIHATSSEVSGSSSTKRWGIYFADGVAYEGNKYARTRVIAIRDFTSTTEDYDIGDTGEAGGWIFYKNLSGGTWTFYECTKEYIPIPAEGQDYWPPKWSNIIDQIVGTDTAFGTGEANTQAIINQAGHEESAALACLEHAVTESAGAWVKVKKGDTLLNNYFDANITGLLSGTEYQYRAYVKDNFYYYYGDTRSLTLTDATITLGFGSRQPTFTPPPDDATDYRCHLNKSGMPADALITVDLFVEYNGSGLEARCYYRKNYGYWVQASYMYLTGYEAVTIPLTASFTKDDVVDIRLRLYEETSGSGTLKAIITGGTVIAGLANIVVGTNDEFDIAYPDT